MIKSLREWVKTRDKQTRGYLVMFLLAGVALMMLGKVFAPAKQTIKEEPAPSLHEPTETAGFRAERELERRLEEAFAAVEGVGRVRVLVNLSADKETVYASDINQNESFTRENDGQGGSRESRSKQSQEKMVTIKDTSGMERPLVIKESTPKVTGVAIIAQGGDNAFVKDALTKAACTVIGIEANKVQVLKMRQK
jgi:stage III sporulation protein AG